MTDPMTLLKNDHREATEMLKKLATSRPGPGRNSTVERLSSALALHMQIEEAHIYPLVAQHVGQDSAKEAQVEHQLARDGLAQLRDAVDGPGFGAVVAMLT